MPAASKATSFLVAGFLRGISGTCSQQCGPWGPSFKGQGLQSSRACVALVQQLTVVPAGPSVRTYGQLGIQLSPSPLGGALPIFLLLNKGFASDPTTRARRSPAAGQTCIPWAHWRQQAGPPSFSLPAPSPPGPRHCSTRPRSPLQQAGRQTGQQQVEVKCLVWRER